jgi:hypothetical protein
MHLLVLMVCDGEVSFELCPSFFNAELFISTAACTHEVPSCKDLCITNIDLLRVTNDNASCFRIISTILNMFEKGLNRLLRVPCAAHLFKIVFKIHSRDVAISNEETVLLNYVRSRNPRCARTYAQINPSSQRATQLRSVLARVYSVSRQNLNTTTVP